MKVFEIRSDCRHFRGYIPCKPHKEYGAHCNDQPTGICSFYDQTIEKVLIIKLGAVGDVIRTTPLLSPLINEYPKAKIFWLSHTPAVVPSKVDVILKYSIENLEYLKSLDFDLVINLDKDREACALLNTLRSKVKKGYTLKEGIPFPIDVSAEHKYMTGLFDDLNRANTKHYIEEIFEICGYTYNSERYILQSFDEYASSWSFNKSKKIIGLNTGCGSRWTSRLWPDKNWIDLAKKLKSSGFQVLFLGGEQEHEKNLYFSEKTGEIYLGWFQLEKFINLVNQCDLVVTGVTMAMHIALGLGKRIVLFNNIFNRREFELFGQGEILHPSRECHCYFQPTCTNKEYQCMNFLYIEDVLNSIMRVLASEQNRGR
jgi:ADP-heptose:LPS heptosyltransferase